MALYNVCAADVRYSRFVTDGAITRLKLCDPRLPGGGRGAYPSLLTSKIMSSSGRRSCIAVHLSLPSVWRSRFLVSGVAFAQTPATALTGLVSSAENNAMEGVLVSASKTGSPVTITVVTDKGGALFLPGE